MQGAIRIHRKIEMKSLIRQLRYRQNVFWQRNAQELEEGDHEASSEFEGSFRHLDKMADQVEQAHHNFHGDGFSGPPPFVQYKNCLASHATVVQTIQAGANAENASVVVRQKKDPCDIFRRDFEKLAVWTPWS